ncbi:MAG TPA: pyridoxal-dependent decarboxylase [Vicinamibacteria bacterium]|nr:pyridoxal-dependent decarboxylase [Vicinamibacteria bacterium]
MLELPDELRNEMWLRVQRAIEEYSRELEHLRVAPSSDPRPVRQLLEDIDFSTPMSVGEALDRVLEGLRHHQVHNGHPRYFGLFNPATSTMSVAADALAAAFNPQLAAWTHAPFACEVERLLIRELGVKFGYPGEVVGGSFTTGGAEANHTALLTALVRHFPRFAEDGLRSLPAQPTLYVSSESHHSFLKAARLCGLGTSAVRPVEVDESFLMVPEALRASIREDRKAGRHPLFAVATLGTTGAGLVDPVDAIALVAHEEGLWVHADAAWGGAAILVPELRPLLKGVERADSITFDAHKWLSVPMGAGMFFTRHPELLDDVFGVVAGYMPRAGEGIDVREPHRSSMQWSRRFIGLKLFLTLLVAGFDGYATMIREMVRLGDLLRERLTDGGWDIVNRTKLPVVCFRDRRAPDTEAVRAISDALVESGDAWTSVTLVGGRIPALRACITNFHTRERDLDFLLRCLSEARLRVLESIS